MKEHQDGSSRVIPSQHGHRLAVVQICYYGFMESVGICISYVSVFAEMDNFTIVAGSGKSIIRYVHLTRFPQRDLMGLASSTIIENIDDMRKRGLALLGFFYCDFRDDDKKNLRGLVSSLLVQLCDQSDSHSGILSEFYSAHGDGSRQPNNNALIGCLRDILKNPGQAPVYIVVDGLDECPNAFGTPSPRENVLVFLEDLINLHLRHLHICITSRPEVDISTALNSLPFHTVTLHNESGQKQDIANYVNAIVHRDPKIKGWRAADKERVIETLTRKADGM